MFHTNDDFLNAIEADPHERTLRLVYADWLDEHDSHDRAELIRVEEEMRQVPVFADRFWELKPRRNELRTLAGSEWCARMRYGTECEPVFRHGIPDGWRERWRLIREFTERWHRVPMPDIGGRQAEIAEAEKRLGRALPPSVREWIAFAHDVPKAPVWAPESHHFARTTPRSSGDWEAILPDIQLARQEGRRTARLNVPDIQKVANLPAISLVSWGAGLRRSCLAVENSNLVRTDPPVDFYFGHRDEAERYTESVTALALELSSACAPAIGGDFFIEDSQTLPPELIARLTSAFATRTKVGSEDYYETHNILLRFAPIEGVRGRKVPARVTVSKAVSRTELPSVLWECAPYWIVSSGLFRNEQGGLK